MLEIIAKYIREVSVLRRLLFAVFFLSPDLPDLWNLVQFAMDGKCESPVTAEQAKALSENIHPGMIPGSSEYPRNPRILRQGGGELCPSRDNPRIVRVSQESQDTQIGGVVSCVHPGMIPGSSEYPRNPRILRQGGSELCPSRDDPGIVRVSQESQDTQTGGG